MSLERRKYVAALGAQLELTPQEHGMKGAIQRAQELQAEIENAWIPQQFENAANPAIHRRTTAQEILQDFPDGVDYLITGVGTGGHITGVGEVLKAHFPHLQVFAVEPEPSQVLRGGEHHPHGIQGIGAGFVPPVLNTAMLAGVIPVSQAEAFTFAARCAKEEGIFVGISSGASLAAVQKKLPDIQDGSVVLTFAYDTGERYLSVPGLFD